MLIGQTWKKLAARHGLDITVIGPTPLITFSFNYPNAQEIKTLFVQEMLKRGFLAGLTVYVSYSHTPGHIRKYEKAVDEVFAMLRNAIANDSVRTLLEGPVVHTGFARLT